MRRTQRIGETRPCAVFLDKDGTLVEDVPFNVDLEKLRIYPEVPAGLVALQAAGYKLIVVSNQPGIAHGYFDDAAVDRVGKELRRRLDARGIEITAFYYCPHHPQGRRDDYAVECNCRKPAEGLLYRAADEHGIDLEGSWMVGDILNDVEAGNRAGCRTVLIDRGNETEWVAGKWREPHHVASDMIEASRRILAENHQALEEIQ